MVEDLSRQAAHRAFDRDRPDRRCDSAGFGARRFGDDLVERKARPIGGERDQGQAAELLRTIAGVGIEMAFTLDQHPAPALRQKANREMVGQRP